MNGHGRIAVGDRRRRRLRRGRVILRRASRADGLRVTVRRAWYSHPAATWPLDEEYYGAVGVNYDDFEEGQPGGS